LLSGLSDRELLNRVKDLAARERAITLEILLHLIEVDRRRLHLGLGCSSMFEYATRHLGYSESAAGRRIRAARCIRDYPEVRGLLEKSEVTLITVSLVAPILNESNAKEVISKIRRKSQREVEGIVAAYRPPLSMRDQARPVRVAVPVPALAGAAALGALPSAALGAAPTLGAASTCAPSSLPIPEPRPASTQRTSRSIGASAGSEAASGAGGPPQAGPVPQAQPQATSHLSDAHAAPSPVRLEEKFLVKFLASKAFVKKLEKAKALLSNGRGHLTYEAVLEAALDEFLKDHDPEERKKRRDERREKAEARTKSADRRAKKTTACGQADDPLSQRWIGGLPASRAQTTEEPSRRIPAPVRDAVYARDKGRCAYIGSNGERCGAAHHLQVDHIVPCARGGTNAIANLRLLCERHNKIEAERIYGANAMKRFRARE
jgi:hypothetical protein